MELLSGALLTKVLSAELLEPMRPPVPSYVDFVQWACEASPLFKV